MIGTQEIFKLLASSIIILFLKLFCDTTLKVSKAVIKEIMFSFPDGSS